MLSIQMGSRGFLLVNICCHLRLTDCKCRNPKQEIAYFAFQLYASQVEPPECLQGVTKIQFNPVADDVCVEKRKRVGEVMAVSVTECSAFLFEKNLAPRSLKPGSADWLIVGRAVQIQSPQLCGSKPNSTQFKHAHAQHTQHTHTQTLKAGFTVFK